VAVVSIQRDQKNKPIEVSRPTLTKQELESVLDCLIQDQLGSGEIAKKFEKTFASAFNFKHVAAVNSLTSAYHLSMLALGIGPGDRVLMSSIAPLAACDAVRYTGAEVLLVDIDRDSFHPAAAVIEQILENEKNTHGNYPAAFILDHSFGSVSPLNTELFREKNIKIIEDFTGLVGSFDDSFSPGLAGNFSVCGLSEQDLITTGNGAVIITHDAKLHAKVQSLRYGSKRTPGAVAYDYRLPDFHAAMGLDQLTHLSALLSRRKKIGIKYLETIRQTQHSTFFKRADLDAYLRFPVIIGKTKEETHRYFNSLHIGIRETMEIPLHHLLEYPRLEFPNAERLYQKSVCIPLFPNLTANNVERICSSLRGLI
jgi:perosamine synthetase